MKQFALLIGISEYHDPKIGALKKSISDVEALERVLGNPERGGFSVTRLSNCTKREAERAMNELTKNRVHGEKILFYFSGHGIRDDDGNLYLAVKDTECEHLPATAILAPSVCAMYLDKSLASEQLVILDCCHSGSFSPNAKAVAGDSVGTKGIFFQAGRGRGRVVLTASDETSYAYESGGDQAGSENSVFTQYLIKGIESGEADLEGDGIIDADELYRYVHREVQRVRPEQRPLKFSQAQEGRIVVSRTPLQVRPLPAEILSAVRSTIPGFRRAIVEVIEDKIQNGTPGEQIGAYRVLRELARDESREVRERAEGVLNRISAPPGFTEVEREAAAVMAATASASIPRPAAVKRKARKKAEPERVAREKAGTEKQAELEAQKQAELERNLAAASSLVRSTAREKAGAEKQAAVKREVRKTAADALLREAELAYVMGKFIEAQSYVERAEAIEPDHPDVSRWGIRRKDFGSVVLAELKELKDKKMEDGSALYCTTSIYLAPDIPPKKLANAKKYCMVEDTDEVLGLFDLTWFGSATDAFVFGRVKLYHRHLSLPYVRAWAEMEELKYISPDAGGGLELRTPGGCRLGLGMFANYQVAGALEEFLDRVRAKIVAIQNCLPLP